MNLSDVRLTLADCISLSSFFSTHSCIDMPTISFSGCYAGSAGLKSISNGLRNHRSVHKLDLRQNVCRDGSVFSSIICSLSTCLVEVDVSYNGVGRTGAISVCQALHLCRRLCVAGLSVLSPKVSDTIPLASICDVVESCPQLRGMYAHGYCFQFDSGDLERFVSAAQHHGELSTLYISRTHGDNPRLVSRLDRLVSDPSCSLVRVL
eukprot:scpid58652/ scgid20559/ 